MTHKIIPFALEHLDVIALKDSCLEEIKADPGALSRMSAVEEGAYTLVADGRVIACGGATVLWNGVAQIWILPSIYVEKYAKTFMDALHLVLEQAVVKYKLRRVQCFIGQEFENGARWMEYWGFKKEATLEQYGPTGKTYDLYARIYGH